MNSQASSPAPERTSEENEEEQVMSEIHIGCPPKFTGPFISHFTFSLPHDVEYNGSKYEYQVLDDSKRNPEVSLDDDGDLALPRRSKRSKNNFVVAIQHNITSSIPKVGLQIWRAELVLSDFVLHKMFTSSEFDGIVALELGAGTGLVGMLLARVAKTVYLTDHGFEILENCASNVNLNSALLPSKASVNVRELDWKASWPPQQSNYPSGHRTPENEVWDFFFTLMEDVREPSLAEVGYKSNRFTKLVIQGNVVEKSEEEPRRSNVKNVNLLKVFKEIDDCFISASESAYEVSRILEANKLHHHSIRDNRGLIDHSTRLMRAITLNRTFIRPQFLNDPKDYFVYTDKETLATILDKMLEWEKKLYKQAKAGEDMKYAYQKKIASLNKLKKGGASNDSLERAQVSVNHLHTRYTVDMRSINSIIAEINLLRDEQLYPKLVQLVQEMATMWENMQKQHEHQSTIIHALQNFITSELPDETSDYDLNNTQQLHHRVKIWSTEFQKLVQHQNNYIKSLENWLKYNLLVTINHNLKPQYPKIESLLRAWLDELDKLPKEDTITAMEKFAEDIHTIVQLQSNKMKMKEKCDETRKKFSKESQKFEKWCNEDIAKKLSSYDEIDDKEVIEEQKIIVEALKLRLVVEEETYEKLCDEMKDTMVANLTTRLPEVLKAVSEFARACSLMYKNLNMQY